MMQSWAARVLVPALLLLPAAVPAQGSQSSRDSRTGSELRQNYPNPFNAGTTIPVQIAGEASRMIRLEIFDVLGRSVRTLMSENAPAGNYSLFWDGRDDRGSIVSSGVYFARLRVDGQTQQVRSMVLIK